jgi:conjugal transfer/type IV secretion protein DotA/TraY
MGTKTCTNSSQKCQVEAANPCRALSSPKIPDFLKNLVPFRFKKTYHQGIKAGLTNIPAPKSQSAKLALMNSKTRFMAGLVPSWARAFLLPFALVLMLGATAPTPAYAAAPTGGGVFDCLGNYDWGCRIVSFLFLQTDNKVIYIKGDREIEEQPTIIEKSFHKMLGFFSNAMLIIASLKLLFELLQMVAETAHTGTVGGKGTDTLWAPIRLVVAIGLLVPLSSGLNSGQYIVIQVAKWGSGLASQTWKVFTETLKNESAISKPQYADVSLTGLNIVKDYICMKIVNHYAQRASVTEEIVTPNLQKDRENNEKIFFGSKAYHNVCGQIIFPKANNSYVYEEDMRYSEMLTLDNKDLLLSKMPALKQAADGLSVYFLPPKDTDAYSADKAKELEKVELAIKSYQTKVKNWYETKLTSDAGKKALEEITTKLVNASSREGWTSAGTWFLAITRAQGQVITGGFNIPQASGPNTEVLRNFHPSASAAYSKFSDWFPQATREWDISARGASSDDGSGLGIGGGLTPTQVAVPRIENDPENWFSNIRDMSGRQVIDLVLNLADTMAVGVGLWTSDSTKAFGDLGSGANPFGEIAAFGHKKIRLGLDYMGMAITVGIVALVPGVFTSAAGTLSLIIASVFMFLASMFLMFGIILGFVIPIMPFMRFLFAIVTWLATLLEAIISMPFVALAHLTPKEGGFIGPNARSAYNLLFQIFLRPVLSVFGLVAALIIFYVSAKFLNATYYEAAKSVGIFNGGMAFIAKVAFSVFYVVLLYLLANTSFKMIEQIVSNAMRWMGSSASEEKHDETNTFSNVTAPLLGSQFVSQFANSPGRIFAQPAATLGNKLRTDREKDSNESKALASRGKQKNSDGSTGSTPAVQTAERDLNSTRGDIADKEVEIKQLENDYDEAPPPRKATIRARLNLARSQMASLRKDEIIHESNLKHAKEGLS